MGEGRRHCSIKITTADIMACLATEYSNDKHEKAVFKRSKQAKGHSLSLVPTYKSVYFIVKKRSFHKNSPMTCLQDRPVVTLNRIV